MALQKPNFNLLGRSALNVKRSKISASTFSSPLKMSKNISFMKSPGVGQKLTSGSLQSIFGNQELLKAPSIPNAGEGILSSNLILTELSETNRILGEIQKQLAIDFTNRITEKEKNLSNMRKGIFGKRSKDEEDALEAKKKIDKESSFLSKTFDAVTKPAKGIFEKLKEFFALLLTGIVTSAAFEWLKDEGNRKKLSEFFDWVADHWKWIVGVIVGGVLIKGLLGLLGALGGIKTLINLIPRRIPRGPGGGLGNIPCLPVRCVPELAASRVLKMAMIAASMLEAKRLWPWLKDIQGKARIPESDAPGRQPIPIPDWVTAFKPFAESLIAGKIMSIKSLIDLMLEDNRIKSLTTRVETLESQGGQAVDSSTSAESSTSSLEKAQSNWSVAQEKWKELYSASTVFMTGKLAEIKQAWSEIDWRKVMADVNEVVGYLDLLVGLVGVLIPEPTTSGAGAVLMLNRINKIRRLWNLRKLAPSTQKDGGLIVPTFAKGGKTKRKKKACCSNCAMGFSAGKMSDGGKLNGPSHAEGGIPIEVEGGEYIVNKSDTTKFLPILEDINYNSGEMWQHFVNATSILNTNLKDQLIINDKISKILTEFNDKLYDLSLAYATDTVMARASQVSDIPSLASSTSSFSGATASLTPVVTVIPKLLTVGKRERVVRNVSLDIPGDSTTIDARSNKSDVSSESVAVKPMASTQGISMTPSPVDSYNVSRMAAVYSLYGIG